MDSDVLIAVHRCITHIRALAISGENDRIAELADAIEIVVLELRTNGEVKARYVMFNTLATYESRQGPLPFEWRMIK